MLTVLAAGPSTIFQDHGRLGWLDQGVARSGAFDRAALDLANRLVGNVPGTVALEILLGGCRLQVVQPCTVALCGALGPASMDRHRAAQLRTGEIIDIGRPTLGVRTYLAIRGGFVVDPVLGSRSWDSLGRFGPAPLCAGDELNVASDVAGPIWFDSVVPARRGDDIVIQPGPHVGYLGSAAWHKLSSGVWRIGERCDRVGVQLDGAFVDCRSVTLSSFAVLPGSVQLLPDGVPMVLGPDAGTTGGYPVVGVIHPNALAQCRPGDEIRFSRR